jgi:signal transduction histidine kinase
VNTDEKIRKNALRGSDRLLLSSRLAVAVGFGSLLAIMALAGIDAIRVLQKIRRDDDQIRQQFLVRNHLLNDVRSELYLSGTYVRDYLLEPEPLQAGTFRGNLEEVRKQMESALASYQKLLQPEESKPYEDLTTALAQYWQVLDPILTWNAAERREHGYPFLRDQVFPRRTTMLDIASRIAAFNEQQLSAGNESVVALLLKFQNRLTVTFLATLALGLGMAAITSRKIFRLEAHTQERYQEVVEARRQLTNLSDRLVQAQEEERRALSRELHDEVGQSLSAVLVELRNLSTVLAHQREEQAQSHVEMIKGLVENTVRVIRNMSLLLRPSMLDDLGLVPALRWQAREVSKHTSMDVIVDTHAVSDDIPDEHKTCIYRVAQEALHNCSRHSQAGTVRITVEQKPELLCLSIEDDGKGFDVKHSKGLGLLGIEERVTRLGGTFAAHSDLGVGTVLSLQLPLKNGMRNGNKLRGGPIGETDSNSPRG